MKRIISKWWVWLLVALFILINLLITNMNDAEKESKTNNSEIIEGNIDTH
ncbi:hypothetical protein [Cytobacillus oceanisediminis]